MGSKWRFLAIVGMGGRFFSKSLRGVMSYKMDFAGQEGWLINAIIMVLPFVILVVLVKSFLSNRLQTGGEPLPDKSAAM